MNPSSLAQRRPSGRPGASAADLVIAAGALVVSLALLQHGGVGALRHGSQLDGITGPLTACATVALIAWRRAPLGVFVTTAAASVLAAGVGSSLGAPIGPTVALYLLASSRDAAAPWTGRTTATAIAMFAAYCLALTVAESAFAGGLMLHVGLGWAVAWFAGERTRLRHEHLAELEDRALRAEREAQQERRLAATEERARIARDLHDSAGHAINVITVRAGAARLRHDEDPERSRLALREIEEVARHTAAEIDTIVGSLRTDDSRSSDVEPPGLDSLGTLVARHTSAGLDVRVGTVGASRSLSGPVDVAAYRLLQEALTNAARHGLGSARVTLTFREDLLELIVVNPVSATRSSARATGGHGLVGMRERVTLLDGCLQADRVNGSFRVRAELPYGTPRP